jgi:hypothetical protein
MIRGGHLIHKNLFINKIKTMKPITTAIAFIMCMATSQMTTAAGNNPPATTGEIAATSVHIRAARDFARLHKNIRNVKWYATAKGYAASFDLDGKNIKVVYDNNGMRQYSIISYTEKYLDYIIRDLVKRKYYDHTIIGVHRFEFENGKTVYVIKMTDEDANAMTLQVYDGQIEVINSLALR